MKISDILIEDKIKEKLLWKHDVRASEIKDTLIGNPFILKIRGDRYMAIGHSQRFITIIFEMIKETAFIITAYPSTDAHRRLYKLKRGGT